MAILDAVSSNLSSTKWTSSWRPHSQEEVVEALVVQEEVVVFVKLIGSAGSPSVLEWWASPLMKTPRHRLANNLLCVSRHLQIASLAKSRQGRVPYQPLAKLNEHREKGLQKRGAGALTVCRRAVLPMPSETRSGSPNRDSAEESWAAVLRKRWTCQGSGLTGSEMWSGSPTCVVRCEPGGRISTRHSHCKHCGGSPGCPSIAR